TPAGGVDGAGPAGLDYETGTQHVLTVRAYDNASHHAEAAITVTITDSNETGILMGWGNDGHGELSLAGSSGSSTPTVLTDDLGTPLGLLVSDISARQWWSCAVEDG